MESPAVSRIVITQIPMMALVRCKKDVLKNKPYYTHLVASSVLMLKAISLKKLLISHKRYTGIVILINVFL